MVRYKPVDPSIRYNPPDESAAILASFEDSARAGEDVPCHAAFDLPPGGKAPFPSVLAIAGFALFLGLVTFLVRVVFPVGYTWELFNLQVPFFPQYIAFFAIGLYAARNDWFSRVPARTGRTCGLAAVALALALPLLFVALGAASGDIGPILGGLHWQALLYAVWEQLAGTFILVGLMHLFATRLDRQGLLARAAAADTYTVYIIHPLVIIPLSAALMGVLLPPLLKFCAALLLGIPLCFSVAHGLRELPGAKRVL